MSGSREKLRAVLLSFVMVTSIMAAGVVFSGTAAAATNINTPNAQNLADGGTHTITYDTTADDNLQAIELDYADGSFDSDGGSLGSPTTEDVEVTISNVNNGDPLPLSSVSTTGGNNNVLQIDLQSEQNTGSAETVTITVDGITIPDRSNNPYDVDLGVGETQSSYADATAADNSYVVYESSASGAPSITSVTKTGAQELTVEFSEGVTDSDAADNSLVDGDFTYVDNNGGGASGFNGQSHAAGDSTLTLTTNNVITSSDVGSDSIFATTSVEDIDDTASTQNTVTIQEPLAGDSNNEISTEIDGSDTQNLRAGSSGQSLGLIQIKDISGGNSPLSQRTILRMPDGVTINEAQTDLVVTTTSGGLGVTGTEVVDESTLRIDHSGSSDSNQVLRVNGLVVDTAADVDASQGGTANDIEVDYAIGSLDSALLTIEKPQIQTGASEDVSAGTSGQDLTDSISPITIKAGSNVDGQIANNTDIVLNANQSNGITFNTDSDPTTISATTSGNAEVDMSEATLTETALTIPVTSHFAAGDSLDIDTSSGDELLVDVSGDATNAKFSGTVVANDTTGDVALEQSNQNPDLNVQNPDINIEESGQQLAVGLDEQLLAEGSALSSQAAIEVEDTAGDQIAAGENVTIQLNSSAVTFDTSRDTNVLQDGSSVSGASDNAILDAAINNDGNIDVDAVTINENTIEVSIVADGRSSTNSGDTLELGDVGLNVSTTAEADSAVEFEALTRSGSSAPDVTSVSTDSKNSGGPESNQFVTLERPDFELNGNDNQNIDTDQSENMTVPLDGDGFEQRSPSGGDDALVVSSNVLGQIADTTNVTIQLEENTGVTFDTRSAGSTGTNNDDGTAVDVDVDDGDLSATNIVVNEKSIDIVLADDTSGSSGPDAHLDTGTSNEIVIDDLVLNGTSGASNTDISVTTNATVSSPDGSGVAAGTGGGTFTSTADNEVTTTLGNIIVVNENTPDSVFVSGDIDTDDGGQSRTVNTVDYASAGDGEETTSVAVGSGVDSSVYIENSSNTEAFGGADVSLDVVLQPDSESYSAGDLLNVTSLTTASDGTADVNFTAPSDATTGTYKINASTSAAGENITYSVTSGDASQFNVTGFDNAVIDESGLSSPSETEVAAHKVRIEDAGGNLVSNQDVDVAIQVDNGELQGVTDNINNGDTSNNQVEDADGDDRRNYDADAAGQNTQGVFYVFTSSTSPGDVDVTVSEGGISDTGTATIFDAVDSVAVNPESSTVDLESTVNVTATAQTSDGTTVEVPRLTLNDLSSDNSTVLERSSLSEEANGGTFANGTVEGTFDTKTTAATANVTADIAGATGEAAITVAEQASDFQLELVDGPTTFTQNESYSATVNVTNEGDASGTQDITYALENDSTGNTPITASNDSVELGAGESTEIDFSVAASDTASLDPGAYTHVFNSDDDELTVGVDVLAESVELGTLDIDVEPDSVPANQSSEVSVQVFANETGEAVEGATVSLADGDQSETTNADGLANFTVSPDSVSASPIVFDISADGFESTSAATTVEEDSTAISALIQIDLTADRDVQTAKIPLFSETPKSASYTLLPHHVYNYTRIHNGELR